MALPPDWDPDVFKYQLSDIEKYNRTPFDKMADYVKAKKVPHLGTGTERIVDLVDVGGKTTALKTARNPAGVFQNADEVKLLSDPRIKKLEITIPLIDYDKKNKNPVWIQTAVAQKISDQYFKNNYGADIEDIVFAATDAVKGNIKDKDKLLNRVKGDKKRNLEILFHKLTELAKLNFDIEDLHVDNWGLYNDHPIIIDAGYFKTPVNEEVLDEMPLPVGWDPEEFGPRAKFKNMIDYAVQRAQKMGTGSSRVAFIIEYEGRPTILKVAKNKKGLAQNKEEIEILTDYYTRYLNVLIPLIDYDNENPENPRWLQLEKADKASEKKLCNLLGCVHLFDLVNYAETYGGRSAFIRDPQKLQQTIKSKLQANGKTEKDIDNFISYAEQLYTLQNDYNVLLGDLDRAANWGIYKGKPVIIDIGFTQTSSALYK